MGYSISKEGALKGVTAADPNRKPRRKKGEPIDQPTALAEQSTPPEGASDGQPIARLLPSNQDRTG